MNNTPPQPVNPPAQADNTDETAARGIESTGSPPTVGDATGPAASGTDVLRHIGDYLIVRKIGEGGMGAVYLAEDTKLHRKAAIKTMKPELAARQADRDRFLREARAAAAVESDHIVPIWQIGEAADGTPFIAMPFLQGEMLADRLQRDRVCNLGVLVKVAREVADGLAAAHAKGLIHRDIKPGNIWLEGDRGAKELAQQVRRAKILDFGLARSVDKEDIQITASGAILGTPAYMAPEQARGEKVDHRADLWSLGVMLYRMAAGHLPFRGPNSMAVLIALATETPPPVRTLNPNLPPALADLIDRLMCKNPAGRPQSAAEVSDAVRQIVKDVQAKRALPAAPAPVASGSQPVPVYVLPAPAPSPWEDVTEADEGEDAPIAKAPAAAKRGRAALYVVGGLLTLLALVAVLVVVIIRVQTAEGTLVVEITDPDVEARIKNGKLVLVGADGKEKYTITSADRNKTIDAGQYSIRVEGADGLALNTNEFTLKKNGQVTVRVTLDPKLAKKDEAKAAPFRELHGASLADLEKWMKSLRDDGFIPSYLSADAGSGRFTAVAVPNPSKTQWRFLPRYERGTAEALRTRQAQLDAGFRPAILCPHLGDPSNESHVWVADGRANGGWYGSREFILRKLKDVRAAQFRPTFLTAGPHKDGGTVYQFQEVPDGGRDWDAQLELTAAELPDIVAKMKGKGWRPDWLSAYGDGDRLRFQAVFVETTDRAGWGFQMGLTAKEYEERLADAARQKSPPLAVAGYSESGQTRYAVVWSKQAGGAAPDLTADRTAAEWAVSVGGRVRVNDDDRELRVAVDLPKEPFRLRTVDLENIKPVSDASLGRFKDCKHLTRINLDSTAVGDAGLIAFKGCKTLTRVQLSWTQVTNLGVSYFGDCQNLTHLWLHSTGVTRAGLAHFKDCKNLTDVRLGSGPTNNASLEQLAAHKALQILHVSDTQVTDAGLAYLKNWEDLSQLNLEGTPVTDAGLEHVKNCRNLTQLWLHRTKVTAKGVADLAKALPQCKIVWDGGTIQPTVLPDPDRRAALYVLSLGGNVQVNDERLDIAEVDPIATEKALPKEPFRLTVVNVWGKGTVTADGLAVCKDCKHITTLWAANASVTDESLAHFKNSGTIAQLNLHNTPVTDAGMAHFKGRKSLKILNIGMTKVGDDGLAHLKECENLSVLHMYGTSVTDGGLAHFSGWKQLTSVELHQTQVTDVGLARIAECKNLTRLTLGQTKVTAKGVADLAKAIPQCKIEWDGGVIEPAKK